MDYCSWRNRLKTLKDNAQIAVKVGVSVYLIQEYIGGFVVCNGPSMEPTIQKSTILLTDHISPRVGFIRLGDVVVARSPINYQCICKRVVALPGDRVKFHGRIIQIPSNSYWLEGDNKENSNDSRDYGPVPQYLIRRRCFCKIWPDVNVHFGNEIPFCIAAILDSDEAT